MGTFSRRFFLTGLFAEIAQTIITHDPNPLHLLASDDAPEPAPTIEIPTPAPKAKDPFCTVGPYLCASTSPTSRFLAGIRSNAGPKYLFANYLNHRGEINNAVINAYELDDDGSKRLGAWNNMLWDVKTMHDPMAKASAIFDWVREVIPYDYIKLQHVNDHNPEWDQTPQITLTRGKGVCIDQALLLLESLYRVGFDPKTVKYESMTVDDLTNKKENGHATIGVHIDGKKYVFDTCDRVGIWHESAYYWSGGFDTEKMTPYMAAGIDEILDYDGSLGTEHTLSSEERTSITVKMSSVDQDIADKILRDAKALPHADGTIAKMLPFLDRKMPTQNVMAIPA